MNATSVRPQTKVAAALVAAGVVSAASLGGVAENRGLPVLNIDVAKTSVITDALFGFGNAVNGVASGLALASDASSTLPFDTFTAFAIATQNPSIGPNLLAWLIQRYTNPSNSYPYYTYPWDIKEASIVPLAGLLPAPLSDGIINAVNGISDAINDVLSGLPSSDPAVSATDAFWASDIGRTVTAANLAVVAPMWMLYNTAYYLGYLPANLEATLESAIQDPSEIPGLVSNLVYGLLSPVPNDGLLGDLLANLTDPLTTLPGPVGQLATNVVTAVANSINNVLSLLPPPITPTPFPSALKSAVLADQVEASSVPDPSLDVANAITLSSVDPVEKKVEATDSTENTPPVTPKDTAPAADDVDPDATPAADTDAPEVKPDKPVTDKVKSGNKVKPGDKFGSQTKGETAKGEDGGTTTTTPGTDGAAAGDTADPTGPPAGDTDNAGDPDSGDASGAAA